MMDRVAELLGRGGLTARAPHRAGRIYVNEGPRGLSTRASVYLRHVAYWFLVIMCSAITHWCFHHVNKYLIGGEMMFALAMLTLAAAAVGTLFYTNQRNEILSQARHYTFGLMLLPGTVLALIIAGAQTLAGPAANASNDQFMAVLLTGLPMVYFATVVIPPILFIKMLAGIRHLHRSKLDDQEMMTLWTRQDHIQH